MLTRGGAPALCRPQHFQSTLIVDGPDGIPVAVTMDPKRTNLESRHALANNVLVDALAPGSKALRDLRAMLDAAAHRVFNLPEGTTKTDRYNAGGMLLLFGQQGAKPALPPPWEEAGAQWLPMEGLEYSREFVIEFERQPGGSYKRRLNWR